MKLSVLCSLIAAGALCAGCAHVGPPADASARLVCKDGTPLTHNGECGGRGGIDRQASTDKTRTLRDTQVSGAAAAGQPGEVWATPAAKTYLCQGDPDYGRSKEGQFMSQSDARAKGLKPASGSHCGS
jgi:hypothetical protein